MTDRLCKMTAAALLATGITLLIAAGAVHTPNNPKTPAALAQLPAAQNVLVHRG